MLALACWAGAHRLLHDRLVDLRQSLAPRDASGKVVVVAIDSPSISAFGVWPWPRTLHGKLLDALDAAGAGEVAFDVDFSSASTPDADKSFVDSLRSAGGSVILPAFKQFAREGDYQRVHVNRPLPMFGDVSWTAWVNVSPDAEGTVRHYPFGGSISGEALPSMAALLAGSQRSDSGSFHLDFGIRVKSIPVVSFADVIAGSVAPGALRDKKIIVGGTAIELGDRFLVPGHGLIAGPLLQALATESILQGRTLAELPAGYAIALAALLLVLMIAIWRRTTLGGRLLVLLAISATVEIAAYAIQASAPVIVDTSICQLGVACYLGISTLHELGLRRFISQIAENRFHQIAMSLGDAVICADATAQVKVWNHGAAAIFGFEASDMLGQPVDFLRFADGSIPFDLRALPVAELKGMGGLVREVVGRRRDGTTFPAEACFSAWNSEDGLHYGIVLRDISKRKKEAEQILYLANHDALTGLANRRSFQTHMCVTVEAAKDQDGQIGLLFVDLDTFKEVNDTLGHAAGDQVLIEVARLLQRVVGAADFVARLGGDEFAVVLRAKPAAERIATLAREIKEAFAASSITVDGQTVPLQCSIGAAHYPQHGLTVEELLSAADLAVYQAKAEGRNRCILFDPSMRDALSTRLVLEAELRTALSDGQFELFYQPQVNLQTAAIVGAEALIRWHHPVRGLLAPGHFMPVVNMSTISTEVAVWVLGSAMTQARKWELAGQPLRVSVNLSPSLLRSGELSQTVETMLGATGLSPSLLELEVTEDILLVDEKQALDTFRKIQNMGVLLAFDDFGTGYASLTYLKTFPLDVLKIDRSFVAGLRQKRDDAAIVEATVGLGKQFNLVVIAEGIEDAETVEILRGMGCHEGQGYYFGRPMPARDLQRILPLAGGARADVSVASAA